jgi:hypothetical protein
MGIVCPFFVGPPLPPWEPRRREEGADPADGANSSEFLPCSVGA